MGKIADHISDTIKTFIQAQKMFFVATACKDGRINISPKGIEHLKVIDKNTVIWLNLTGSGNETAAHVLEDKRMTIMMNAFEGNPLILRLYGKAKFYHPNDDIYKEYSDHFKFYRGARQIFVLDVEGVQTSCGFGVPLYEYKGERELLDKWTDKKSDDEIIDYWANRNAKSIDGKETGILKTK